MLDTDILLPADLALRLTRLHARLEAARPLPAEALANLAEQYRLESTYSSNAIEGNTLTLPETKLVLELGVTVGGKPLAHHIEAVNTAAAWDRLLELIGGATPLAELLSHATLQELHELVMRGLSPDAGRYRTVNVRIVGSRHSPPDWSKVLNRMEALLVSARAALAGNEGAAPSSPAALVEAAARFHHGLEAIHPFSDGNGRVGRLALNLLYLRAGLPPLILRVDQRRAYYRALAQADGGNLEPLSVHLGRALQESFVRHLGSLGDSQALLPLRELVAAAEAAWGRCPYTADYLALRARQGKLAAAKLEGVWHSSVAALEEYLRSTARKDQ